MTYLKTLLAVSAIFFTSLASATIMTESHHGSFSLWTGAKDYTRSYYRSAHSYDRERIYLSGFDTSKGELLGVSIKYDTGYYLSNKVYSHDHWSSASAYGYGRAKYTIKLTNPYGDTDRAYKTAYSSCYDNWGYSATCRDYETRRGSYDGGLWTPHVNYFKDISSVVIDVRADIWANLKGCGWGDDYCYDYAHTDWWGKVWLEYTYKTPVPEPGTLGLLGLGLLGLGLSRRLRRS